MQQCEVDMTEFFRNLADVDVQTPQVDVLASSFYQPQLLVNHRSLFAAWLERYALRVMEEQGDAEQRRARMNQTNPRFVLRNYLAQQAIEAAEQGDLTMLHRLLEASRHPYAADCAADLIGLRPEWARNKVGASMLSCSS
jgi:uncharacterized protein YdiU (UPF0061 family)